MNSKPLIILLIISLVGITGIVFYGARGENHAIVAIAEKVAGTYEYGYEDGESPGHSARVFPRTNNEVEVALNAFRGAPSYNQGWILLKVALDEDGYGKYSDLTGECSLSLSFSETGLIITSLTGTFTSCGYGHGLSPEGSYPKISSEIPEYYYGVLDEKIYFDQK